MFLNSFLKEMHMRSIQNILNSEKLTAISLTNTFGKSFQYFLYCDIETLHCYSKYSQNCC